MFTNRINELKLLQSLYREKKPKLVILYGKRRVGKTALLLEFAAKHKALYLVARQESVKDQLRKISEEAAAFFQDVVLKSNPFQNYDALFRYLQSKDSPVFFDEFPFLVESHPALPSILQEHWDHYFSKKNSFIVLCGSSIRMMESLLGYTSPLYGRRTEQILLEPLLFKDTRFFFPSLKPEQQVEAYAVLGGTPAYLLEFDYSQSLFINIQEKILQKNKFLYQDVMFVIQQELNEPRTYYSLIKSIAKGNTKLGNIVNDTGLEKEKVTKYLSVLQQLQLIERRIPITEKHPEKFRKGIYVLRDQYFKFWFRFIFENTQYIEQNKPDLLLTEKITPELNQFIGQAYEEIALQWVKQHLPFHHYLFGRWWDRTQEIDIIGLDQKNARIIFGEVKWRSLSEKEARQVLAQLQQKSESVAWEEKASKTFMLIGKEIDGKVNLRKEGYEIFDLKDICGLAIK